MKKKIALLTCCLILGLTGCGSQGESEGKGGLRTEPIPAAETAQTQESQETKETAVTQEQALEAIRQYCIDNNPSLEEMTDSDDYTLYWDVSESESGEIVVLYRSYTGAQIRYYIDPASGETYVTEQVPGIIDEEQRTEEKLNVRDYLK